MQEITDKTSRSVKAVISAAHCAVGLEQQNPGRLSQRTWGTLSPKSLTKDTHSQQVRVKRFENLSRDEPFH